jgi:N-methylhydantoinase A
LWDAYVDLAPAYIRRRDRLEVTERIDYSGQVVTPLDETEARQVARTLKQRGISTVAIAFINAYVNGRHEARTKQILLEEHPRAFVTTSHELLPEMFEFERTSTTVVNAVLGPVMARYLSSLREMLAERGYRGDVLITHSAGGVMTAEVAVNFAARLANSGPAAGATASAFFANLAGFETSIGLDMGGTSADVSLTYRGETRIATEWYVEPGSPIMFPCVDMVSIGAGGGSVAWVDAGGSLRNGPQSMGADPGPACYGKGGEEATNTDANLVLGRLSARSFLGGRVKISKRLAERAIDAKVAKPLGYDVVEAADAIVQIANANMMDAIRLVSVRRGYDPREFVLVAFGGAGPLHAPWLIKELSIPAVVVPPWPGLTSSFGCQLLDLRHDVSKTVIMRTDTADLPALEHEFQQLEAEVADRLTTEGVRAADQRIVRQLDMRYLGQWRALRISCPRRVNRRALDTILDEFHSTHQREHAFSRKQHPVEIYGVRVVGLGVTKKPRLRRIKSGTTPEVALKGREQVYFAGGGFEETPVYERHLLPAGADLEGPCRLDQMDSTVVIPPRFHGHTDAYGNVIIRAR